MVKRCTGVLTNAAILNQWAPGPQSIIKWTLEVVVLSNGWIIVLIMIHFFVVFIRVEESMYNVNQLDLQVTRSVLPLL